jgi:hypothetical protein
MARPRQDESILKCDRYEYEAVRAPYARTGLHTFHGGKCAVRTPVRSELSREPVDDAAPLAQ